MVCFNFYKTQKMNYYIVYKNSLFAPVVFLYSCEIRWKTELKEMRAKYGEKNIWSGSKIILS